MIKNTPKHIGIIPDGNRRWAKEHGMNKQDGYEYGLHPGLQLLRQAKSLGIQEITYYGFTVDNCKRPAVQFAAFQKACVDAVELLKQEGADLLVMGNTDSKCFPEALLPYTTRIPVNGGGSPDFFPSRVYTLIFMSSTTTGQTSQNRIYPLHWSGTQSRTLPWEVKIICNP